MALYAYDFAWSHNNQNVVMEKKIKINIKLSIKLYTTC